MPLVSMNELLNKAKEGKYAVGQFNLNNLEFTQAILLAAKEENSPVILGVTEVAADYMGGLKVVAKMVEELIESYGINVPITLHFDHGPSFQKCMEAIQAGFTSVMIDGSHLPLKDNIQITKSVVDVAHTLGISVEAELGRISGQEDDLIVDEADATIAIPSECQQLVQDTGVDCFAPAIGSAHGPYKGKPVLRFERLIEIEEITGVPLALHGGTGIPNNDIKKAISLGIAKVNVNTENQIASANCVRQLLVSNLDMYDPRKYLGPARDAIKEVVKEKMRLFGSAQKS